jgi:tetratricopeptide (TPR) repeat protein
MDVEPQVGGPPIALKELVAAARAAMRRRDWAEAVRRFADARAQSPSQPTFYTGGVNALRAAGRIDEAIELASRAAALFPDDENVAVMLAWLANGRQRWEEAAGLWAEVLRRFPDNLEGHVGGLIAAQHSGSGDTASLLAAAEAALARARVGNCDPVRMGRLELAIAKARSDWPAMRRSAKALTRLGPPAPEHVFLDLAQACWRLGEPGEALAAARYALGLNPELAEAAILVALAATQMGDAEA